MNNGWIFDKYLLAVCFLTSVVYFISTSNIASRIVASRTKRFASSNVMFNIFLLLSQFATTIQAPLLAKMIENDISAGNKPNDTIFRVVIFSATLGTILGGFAIPTLHRFMEKGVDSMYKHSSVFKLFLKSFKTKTFLHFKDSIKLANINNYKQLLNPEGINRSIILMNIVVYSFTTISILSCLYAGYINPELRTTALSMSGIANGFGAILMILLLQPYDAILTDKVIDGTVSHTFFRRHLSFVVISRILGTLCGQFLFIPMSKLIAFLASSI
ncbi:lipid II flippase family protein [Aquirufa nivalisilvae]|uniref:lipid II flippase family protein n=1 Tax=Aquirufa nivalisilvae TaxID=2516557 RepID=UPI001032A9A1|nr:DUF2837 family protein [Aquirufa nivalisilvae]TBH76348.1 DUF2837 family protein [Aquirufa nivalisilvae]